MAGEELVHVHVEDDRRRRPLGDTGLDAGRARASAPYRSALQDEAGLNPRYTFETFVKGASNQFALAAALRVAETPARSYNPLFIYGAAGLGKTHLLHAIGHYVHHNYQHHEVRYVSTETFLNEFVDAIRTNTGNAFKRRYREVDVLLIDDIQFLENREGLQEEFFHTFNSLHGANKQIVISSDRVPDAIPTLEERLRGRFKWGLITDIQPPDLETRLAILRNKAERDQVEVPSEALEFIATKISTNIRELEGALIRVTAYASLNHVPITIELAQHLLADILRESSTRPRTDEELLVEIAGILGFEVAALEGQEPPAPARDGPPDRDVRVPRPHRPQLPRHRPHLRRPRPHDGHPRRREDPAPDERAQADLRPGHRPAAAAEDVSAPAVGSAGGRPLDTVWTSGGRAGDNRRVVHRTTSSSFPAWGRPGTTRRGDTHPLRCGDDGLSPIHSPYYRYYLCATPRCGKGRSVKFRCEREVLADALATAGRAATSRTGTLPVLSGLRLEVTR